MKKLFAIALLASFTTLAAPLQWTCDWPEAKSQTFSLYQGETATFEPTFRVNGRTVTNATIEAVWYQTNGMGNAWWKLDGATFAPSNDVGAAAYRFFVEAKTSDDILYRANGALRMLPSPGFTPNAIEPPIVTLDFANIEVAHAPYYDKTETEAKIVELAPAPDYSTNNTELVETIEATAPAPGDYAAVSNAAVHAAITNALQDAAISTLSDTKLDKSGNDFTVSHTADGLRIADNAGVFSIDVAPDRVRTNFPDEQPHAVVWPQLDGTLALTSDIPDVPAWALEAQKPTYTADEVGAVSSNKIEEVRQDNAQTRQIVTTWENFLDGSNVVFSITNYLSGSYNLDAAKLRILELRDGAYQEVYNCRDEILLHIDDFSNRYVRVALDAIVDEVAARLASKADRNWGKYTSAGGEAPSNTVYMTAPNTVFAGGLEYERVAVGEGTICVLTTRGAPVWTQGDEGTFKFQDDGGTNYFGFAKTDSYTIGANTDGITVQGGMVTMNYNITMSGRPCVWYKSSLSSGAWEQLNLPDGSPVAGASHAVTWEANPDPGTQVCYINVGSQPSGFFKATVEVAGSAKFMTNMPADMSGGIFCTDGVYKVRPVYNNGSVMWEVFQ